MLQSFKRSLFEFVRCTKHNLLHLKVFRIAYVGDDQWTVRHARGEMLLSNYPYLALHDIEGYLKEGQWSIEPGMTVIDAGGCFGEFSIFASQCVGESGRILMLEPDENNLKTARRNFQLNGSPQNITVVQAGLWNTKGTIRFASGQSQQSSIVGDSSAAPSGDIVEVPTVTLADLASEQKLDRLDFVKMDIEGAELEAVSVAKDLPAQFRPRYAIASYHPRDGEATARRLERTLRDLGYATSTGNPRHQTTWAQS